VLYHGVPLHTVAKNPLLLSLWISGSWLMQGSLSLRIVPVVVVR